MSPRVSRSSTGGGKDRVWAAKGGELFYRDGTSVMAAAVQTSPVFRATSPVKRFDGPYIAALAGGFDVSRDGQRFLMTSETANQSSATIVVVINWLEELKNKLPRR